MSGSVGVLDFFVVEASEYVDRLDQLIGAAGDTGPVPDAVARPARALRGSATMARQPGIAKLAAGVERATRALDGGRLRWSPAVRATFVAAVDDLRILLRALRSWSTAEDQRVELRTAELDRLAPAVPGAPDARAVGSAAYLAAEAGALASALEQVVARSSDRGAIGGALRRTRLLRGVAALADAPPFAEVLDGVERAGTPLEAGRGPATSAQQRVLAAAAAALRYVAAELAARRQPSERAPELARFGAAVAELSENEGADADRVVPIDSLFYTDGGPHIVSAAANPPSRAATRFRLEVVSRAEHVRRVVAEARAAGETGAVARHLRELRRALRGLGGAADSFGDQDVARFAARWLSRLEGAVAPASALLGELDAAATSLAGPALRSPATAPAPNPDVVPIERLLFHGRAAVERAVEVRETLRRQGGPPPAEALQELWDLLDLALVD